MPSNLGLPASQVVGAVALSVYMWFTYTKLYEMMNPLHGVELVPGEPTVAPHWAENTTFSVLCFLSSARRFTPFKVSTLKENQALLFIHHGLRYNDLQGEITMHFNITTAGNAAEAAAMSAAAAPAATSGSALAGLSGLLWPAAAPANVTTASVSKAIWKLLRTNTSSVHLHILAVKTSGARAPPKAAKPSKRRGRDGAGGQAENGADAEVDAEAAAPVDPDVAALGGLDEITAALLAEGSALYDVVGMVKFDRVPKSYAHRYLLRDVAWLRDYVQVDALDEQRAAIPPSTVISYWKPEVAVRLVTDFSVYPMDQVPDAIHRHAVVTAGGGSGSTYRRSVQKTVTYKPPLHADEIGLTSDKYIALNATVAWLPLKLSYAPMSLQRWLLMQTMEHSLQAQSGVGFSEKDIDDVRRLISDTSVYLLAITLIASSLHLLFEFLAFQSDIAFWSGNKSLAGLSVRSVVTELFSQIIVFLFLVDSDTSLLVSVPAFAAILIQMWKVHKALGLTVERTEGSWLGYQVVCARLRDEQGDGSEGDETTSAATVSLSAKDAAADAARRSTAEVLTRVTLEADRVATAYMGLLLAPLVLGLAARSLIVDKHRSWYSFCVATLTGSFYTLSFMMSVPQLLINHRLKSVSALPWKYLAFKFLNTFIDDLFAFIIKMPTMHRISVFRDDIIFIIYMYQRWIYRIDESRPVEK